MSNEILEEKDKVKLILSKIKENCRSKVTQNSQCVINIIPIKYSSLKLNHCKDSGCRNESSICWLFTMMIGARIPIESVYTGKVSFL